MENRDKDRKQIIAQIKEAETAFNKQDYKGSRSNFAENSDVTIVSMWGIAKGMDALEQIIPEGANLGQLRYEDVDVKFINDDNALVTGFWTREYLNKVSKGYSSAIFTRLKNGWRSIHDQDTMFMSPKQLKAIHELSDNLQ